MKRAWIALLVALSPLVVPFTQSEAGLTLSLPPLTGEQPDRIVVLAGLRQR